MGARLATSSEQPTSPYLPVLIQEAKNRIWTTQPEGNILATKTKAVLAKEIVETIKSRNGRFLQRVLTINNVPSRRDRLLEGQDDILSHGNMRRRRRYAYREVDDSVAIYKTKQTFRHQMKQIMIAEEVAQDNSTMSNNTTLLAKESRAEDDGTADSRQPRTNQHHYHRLLKKNKEYPTILSGLVVPPLPNTAALAAAVVTSATSSSEKTSGKACEIEDTETTSIATSASAESQRRLGKRQNILSDATGDEGTVLLSRRPTTQHHEGDSPLLERAGRRPWGTTGSETPAAGMVPAPVSSEPRNALFAQHSGANSASSSGAAFTTLSSAITSSVQWQLLQQVNNHLGAVALARPRHYFLQETEALMLARQILAPTSSYALSCDLTMRQPPSFFDPAGARDRDSSSSDINHNEPHPSMLLYPYDLRARLVSLILLQQQQQHHHHHHDQQAADGGDGLDSSSGEGWVGQETRRTTRNNEK